MLLALSSANQISVPHMVIWMEKLLYCDWIMFDVKEYNLVVNVNSMQGFQQNEQEQMGSITVGTQ